MATVVIKDVNGDDVSYSGITDVKLNTSSGTQVFKATSGTKTITSLNEEDVSYYSNAKVDSTNITAGNIKKGKTILGVTGTYEGITPSGNEDIADLLSHDVSTKETAQISADEIAKIIPGNIRYGVTILGVEGSYRGGSGYTHSQSGSVLTADGFYSITQSSTELEVV